MKTTKNRRDRGRRVRKTCVSRLLFVALAALATSTPTILPNSAILSSSATAQTGTQLTVSENKNLTRIDDGVSSVVFTGAFALTLTESQTLTPIFLNQASGAILNLGNGSATGQTWALVGNSPRWTGTTNVRSMNEAVLTNGSANPLGAYSTDGKTAFATTNLYDGATLRVEAAAGAANGEARIGALGTIATGDSAAQNATVDVAAGRTLTVENGLAVGSNVGLTKAGAGVLQLLANGTAATTSDGSGSAGTGTTTSTITAFNLGRLDLRGGTFRLADGTARVDAAKTTATAISVAADSTLDLRVHKTIELAGTAGETVFSAADGATVNLYVDATGNTAFKATTFNTYINLGAATLNVVSDLTGSAALASATVFSTEGVGQTTYSAETLTVLDNILGKRYVVDLTASNAEKIVLKLENAPRMRDVGKTANERSVGDAFDRKIASGRYSDAEYAFLNQLEINRAAVDFAPITGEIYASSIGFAYMNNLTTTQTIFEHLRNNPLIAYSGGAVAPMNYSSGANAGGAYRGGAANGYLDPGTGYYENSAAPYGDGVSPIYEDGGVFDGTGGASSGYGPSGGAPSGYGTGGYGTGANGVDYNFGWDGPLQRSALGTIRGQANYGDPGTLIYSAWFAALGGNVDAKAHKDALGYDGDQLGFLTGLDLFGSTDCRFGAYYGYQSNKMKHKSVGYGELDSDNHLLGIYHQFGDEHVYNIATIRGGYDRYDVRRNLSVLGVSDSFSTKYNGYNAGATYERGANFALQPFVFSPYFAVDYNFLYRDAFDETSATGSGYALRSGSATYNSLRGIVGGRLALDMYPGEQQVRIVARGAYVHEFLDPMYGKTDLRFAALSGADFVVYGNSLGRDWGLVGLGLDWAPIPAFLLYYQANLLLNEYVDDVYNAVGLKFRW